MPAASPVANPDRGTKPEFPAGRLTSVDALRGFDMAWIVGLGPFVQSFVKIDRNPVTEFLDRQLEHVRWEGFHFYDLIYPLFVFVVGVSLVFSLDRARETSSRGALVGRILRRGLVIYVLNFFFNGGFAPLWPQMRVASGVLALIAASYVIAGLIYVFFADRLRVLAGITTGLLLGYWALLGLTPFPDFRLDQPTVEALAAKAGSHSPAAIAAVVPERISGVYEQGHNLSNYLDFRFLPGRLHEGYYEAQGLLSPLTGAAVCLLGVLAGRLLKQPSLAPRRKVLILALSGAAAVGLGLLWSVEFPIVKKLWSSSFCLVAGGCSALLLALFYLVVDVWEWRSWCRPFVWIGMNPITLYLLSSLVSFPKIAERLVGGDVRAAFEHLIPGLGLAVYTFTAFLIVVLLARFLHHRKIFLRV